MKKPITILILMYLVTTVLFVILQKTGVIKLASPPKHYTVTMTHDGFSPDELTIHANNIVDFVNADTANHWPASNPHPVHDIYSQFDPRRSVLPHQTWNMQFDHSGEWHYHDHIIPYHTGTITVVK